MTRVAVILHERLGHWNRQLRPRLHDRPVRWFETRSRADLDRLLTGLACPVVLIDLGRHPAEGLKDLDHILERASGRARARHRSGIPRRGSRPARELGATHVAAGFVPPPFVARLMARWIELAQRHLEHDGWSRTAFPKTQTEPWAWLADFLDDGPAARKISVTQHRTAIAASGGDNGSAREVPTDFEKNS